MALLDTFKAQMLTGGVRPTLFRVDMAFPSFLGTGALAAFQGQFMAKAASLPASRIQPIEVPFQGRPVKFAGEREFDNWTITIINEGDFNIRRTFEAWMDRINGHTTNAGVTFASQYQTDWTVHQLGRNQEILKSYKFVNVFPIELGEISLSYDAANQVEEFQVTVATDYWISDSTS